MSTIFSASLFVIGCYRAKAPEGDETRADSTPDDSDLPRGGTTGGDTDRVADSNADTDGDSETDGETDTDKDTDTDWELDGST